MCQAKLFINYHPDNLLECWNGRSVTLVLPKLPDDDFPHVEVVLVPDTVVNVNSNVINKLSSPRVPGELVPVGGDETLEGMADDDELDGLVEDLLPELEGGGWGEEVGDLGVQVALLGGGEYSEKMQFIFIIN